jgi:hypothetical protein
MCAWIDTYGMPNLKLFYICIYLNIFNFYYKINVKKYKASVLFSPTSSAATFKKNQFFKGYVNQV